MKSCLGQRRFRPSKKSACGLCKPHQRGWAGKRTIADQRTATAHEQQLSDAATAAQVNSHPV
jgi:hypothetical protein